MTRQEGSPVPYEHEFYRAHLLGLLSLDLSASGTFFDGERVGYKNLDSFRREAAKKKDLEEVVLRKQKAFRLPIESRTERVSTLIGCLSYLGGGAKQALHYTDLTPAVIFLGVTRYGNNPFYRMLTSTPKHTTQFHDGAFRELMGVYKDQFLSRVYIGWAQGFLDEERAKLEAAIQQGSWTDKVTVAHPVAQVRAFTQDLRKAENAGWFE
jgi:CRISPR-associated protein Cst2